MISTGRAAYNRTIFQTTDDKKEILLMLYDGAVKFVRYARLGIEKRDAKIKGENISKVLAILTELDCALNREMEEGMIENLSLLYRYMFNRLTVANVKNDTGALTEVEGIIVELKEAFETAFGKENVRSAASTERVESEKKAVSFAV